MTDTQAESRPRAEVDLDHHSPEFREDPYSRFREMRDSGCPVAHSDHYEGFWALVDYASVFEAARDDDLFNSYPSVGVPASELPLPILPIESDPPETQELREVTLKRFSPGSAERFRAAAIEMTDEAIDAFIERGECDLVGELTTPLPARLILRLLNFDESRFMDWVGWVHTTVHDRAHDPEKAGIAGMEMFGEIVKHMEQRRAEGLGDDLFSDILRGTLNGKPLDDGQITMYTVLMMLGGMDTTSGFTGSVLLRLCKDAELRAKF
jgi:cytochrome P450